MWRLLGAGGLRGGEGEDGVVKCPGPELPGLASLVWETLSWTGSSGELVL